MYILPNLKGKEIIMYLRKSRSDDQLMTVEEVLSKHEQMIDEWLTLAMPEAGLVPEENRLREVVSGETLDSRPEMQRMLRLIEGTTIKAIVCKEPARLSRGDLQDIGYLTKVLALTRTLVLTPSGSYDLNDERDREQFERELMRSNDYLKYQKKLLRDGRLLAVKNGWYIGAVAPYGYRKVDVKDGRRTCHTLTPHPEEADTVRRIFEMYRRGKGTLLICDALDAEHVKPPKGDKWAPVSVREILRNEHYIGKVRWNYRPHSQKVEQGEILTQRLTAEDYLLFKGRHPAIVDQEAWDAVRAMGGKIPRAKRGTEMKNPLAGILYCSCGRTMNYKQTVKHGKKIGVPRFLCSDQRCKANGSAIMGEVMDEVTKVLQACVEDFEVRIESGADNSVEIHKQLLERLERKLAELKALEVKQWDEKIKGEIPEHVFDLLNARTVAEIAEVNQALCDAQASAPQHVDLHEKVATLRSTLELLRDPDTPVKELNTFLKACIERIVYSRPRVEGYVGKNGNPAPFRLDFTLRI